LLFVREYALVLVVGLVLGRSEHQFEDEDDDEDAYDAIAALLAATIRFPTPPRQT